MIYTSSYNNWNSDICKSYSISGNRGKDANYEGECYPKLAPKLGFWKIWHENIGVLSEEENNKYYIREFYNQVLSKLDPVEVYNELNNSVLLCYEDNTEFCHRHIVAAWLELSIEGVIVPEVKSDKFGMYEVKKPAYIKEYLKEIMQKEKPKMLTKEKNS